MSEITLKLKEPVMHGDIEVNSLTLRAPESADVIEIGSPVTFVQDGDEITINIKAKNIAKYISKLGNVPPSVVRKLSLPDFFKCQEMLIPFFSPSGD